MSDLDRAVAFYRERLGFTVDEIDPGRNAFLRSGDFLLVLFVPEDPGTDLARDYLARTGGPLGHVPHVAFAWIRAASMAAPPNCGTEMCRCAARWTLPAVAAHTSWKIRTSTTSS